MNWILQSNEFGYPMFIANDFTATDNLSDAMKFDGRDSKETKEKFYSVAAGYQFKAVECK